MDIADCFHLLLVIKKSCPRHWSFEHKEYEDETFLKPLVVNIDTRNHLLAVIPQSSPKCDVCHKAFVFFYNTLEKSIHRACMTRECRGNEKSEENRLRNEWLRNPIAEQNKWKKDKKNTEEDEQNAVSEFIRSRHISEKNVHDAMVRDGLVGTETHFELLEYYSGDDNITFRILETAQCAFCKGYTYDYKFNQKEMQLYASCKNWMGCTHLTPKRWDLIIDPKTDTWICERRWKKEEEKAKEEFWELQKGFYKDGVKGKAYMQWKESRGEDTTNYEDTVFKMIEDQTKKRLLEEQWVHSGVHIDLVKAVKEKNKGEDTLPTVFFVNVPFRSRVLCPGCFSRYLFFSINTSKNVITRLCPNKICINNKWRRADADSDFNTCCAFYVLSVLEEAYISWTLVRGIVSPGPK